MAPTATYTALLDKAGELVIGLADMAIYDELTVDFLEPLLPRLERIPVWFIDCNLPAESLRCPLSISSLLCLPLCGGVNLRRSLVAGFLLKLLLDALDGPDDVQARHAAQPPSTDREWIRPRPVAPAAIAEDDSRTARVTPASRACSRNGIMTGAGSGIGRAAALRNDDRLAGGGGGSRRGRCANDPLVVPGHRRGALARAAGTGAGRGHCGRPP